MLKKLIQFIKFITYGRTFAYCQSEIEGNFLCTKQCDHCKEYYKPLEDKWKN